MPKVVANTAVLDCPPLLVDIGLDQLTISPPAENQPAAELLLIDLGGTPGVPSEPASRPLIDLTANTPDMSRHGGSKAVQAEGQVRLTDCTAISLGALCPGHLASCCPLYPQGLRSQHMTHLGGHCCH